MKSCTSYKLTCNVHFTLQRNAEKDNEWQTHCISSVFFFRLKATLKSAPLITADKVKTITMAEMIMTAMGNTELV